MPYYESVFIARQDITVAQADALSGDFCKIIEDHGGKIAGVERWGLRSLAYKIKKNRKAHYILINIDASGEAIHEMERQMRLNEDVLRHLTIRVDALAKTPSPLAQVAAERHVNVVQDEKPPKSTDNVENEAKKDEVEAKGDKTVEEKKPGGDAAEDVKDAAEDVKGDDK